MRRYHVRVTLDIESGIEAVRAILVGSVDATAYEKARSDDLLPVRIDRVLSVEVNGRPIATIETELLYGWGLVPGGWVLVAADEVEPVYEYWEPGPGEQRLLEATWEERRDA